MEERYKRRNKQSFDKFVRKRGKEYVVYLTGDIEEDLGYYIPLLELLDKDNTTIVFRIKTLGGDLSSSLALYQKIKDSKSKTIAEVYKARSGGSLIMLACDNVKFTETSEVMIHEPQITYERNNLSQYYEYLKHINSLWQICLTIYEPFDRDIRTKIMQTKEVFYSHKELTELGLNKDRFKFEDG